MKAKRVSETYLKKKYLEEGQSIRQIAEELGVVMASVQRWLVFYNIARRPTGYRTWSIEQRQRVSEQRSKKNRWVGENNPNWKGGISQTKHGERAGGKVKAWRFRVKLRDSFTCQNCGLDGKVVCPTCLHKPRMHADHIKPWKDYPELRYDVSNGRTLCEDCHTRKIG